MPVATYQTVPKTLQLLIGETHERDTQIRLIGIVKRDSLPVPRTVMGLVENFGDTAFTIEVDESANNNLANVPGLPASADPYADRAIRVDGSAVSGGTTLCALPYSDSRAPTRPSAHQVCGFSPGRCRRSSSQRPTSMRCIAGTRSSAADSRTMSS